jgi:hypothetical protein
MWYFWTWKLASYIVIFLFINRLFNQSVYGRQDSEETRLNKNKGKVVLAPQIQEIKLICP